MPGKKHNDAGYRYMTSVELYRTVAASDADTLAAVEALATSIDMDPDRTKLSYEQQTRAYENRLLLQCVIDPDTTGSYDIKVYGTMKNNDTLDAFGEDRWCLVHEDLGLSAGVIRIIEDVPPGLIKVMITNIDAGTVTVFQSHSL